MLFFGLLLIVSIAATCLLLIILKTDELSHEYRKHKRLETIYVFASHWNNLLGKAYDINDDIAQIACLDQLRAYELESLNIFMIPDDGSDPADIVRDMIYCLVSPMETSKRLDEYYISRQGRVRDNSRSRVDDVPVWPG